MDDAAGPGLSAGDDTPGVAHPGRRVRPSERVKKDLAADLDHHASPAYPGPGRGHHPAAQRLRLRLRQSLDQRRRRRVPVCGFDLYDRATDIYTDSLLPDERPEDSPQDALDHSVRLHLTGIADQPLDDD